MKQRWDPQQTYIPRGDWGTPPNRGWRQSPSKLWAEFPVFFHPWRGAKVEEQRVQHHEEDRRGSAPPQTVPCCAHAGGWEGQAKTPLGTCKQMAPRGLPFGPSATLAVGPEDPGSRLSMASPSLSWRCPLTGERERISVATVCGPGIMAAAPFPDLRLFSWGNNSAQKARSQVGGARGAAAWGHAPLPASRSCGELEAPFRSVSPVCPGAPAHAHTPTPHAHSLARSWAPARSLGWGGVGGGEV